MANYGRTGTFTAQTGKADELLEILLRASQAMEDVDGCQCYVVSRDKNEPDRIHVFEVWDSKESHTNSLNIPEAKELIGEAMPLLADEPESVELELVSDYGTGDGA